MTNRNLFKVLMVFFTLIMLLTGLCRVSAQNTRQVTDRNEVDADFYNAGTTDVPYNIGNDIYTLGRVAINRLTPIMNIDVNGTGRIDQATDSLQYGLRTDVEVNEFFPVQTVAGALDNVTGMGMYLLRPAQNSYASLFFDQVDQKPTLKAHAFITDSTGSNLALSHNVISLFNRQSATNTNQIRVDASDITIARAFSGGSTQIIVGKNGGDLIEINGANLFMPDYTSARDDSSVPVNFLYTDIAGVLKSGPLTDIDVVAFEYTPTSSADPFGDEGLITYDDDYIYYKSGSGWRRIASESF